MQLKMAKRTVDGIVAFECSGRIVLGEESALLRDEVKKTISDGTKRIVLNLGDVNYIDSSGLGELVAAYTAATRRGGKLKLMKLTQRVQDVVQLTKVYRIFEVFNDEATAVRSFEVIPGPDAEPGPAPAGS